MSDRAQTEAPDQNAAFSSAQTLVVRRVEGYLRAQGEMLDSCQELMAGWLRRRRVGTEAALATLERTSACKEVGETIGVYDDWLLGSLQRVSEDAAAFGKPPMVFGAQATAGLLRGEAEPATSEPRKARVPEGEGGRRRQASARRVVVNRRRRYRLDGGPSGRRPFWPPATAWSRPEIGERHADPKPLNRKTLAPIPRMR